ncbi:MAG: VCBS repeat-containing protein, partial [Candidatus Hydrogenedentota bacterium]
MVVTNPDGQSTLATAKRRGAIRYQAEPGIEGIASSPPEDPSEDYVGWIDGRIPATIPTTFTITGCNFAAATPLKPVAVFRRASGLVLGSVALTVLGDGGVRGLSPRIENLVTDEVVTVSIVDAYGQPSADVTETCRASSTILYSAPPMLESFETTFVDHLGETVTDTDVAPATISVAFSLSGSNFLQGATAVVRQVCGNPDAPIPTLDGLRIPLTILAPGEATGMTPMLPTLADTLTDIEIAIRNPDGQTNAAPYCGIKFNAPPRVTGIVIAGTDDRAIIANGPFRNDHTGLNGLPIGLEISGENLDSRSPTSGNGALGIEFSGGALAVDAVEDVGRQARIVDASAAATELGDNEDGRIADVFGYIDVVRVIDYTGQSSTVGLRDALLTVFGPSAPNEGNAATLVSGDLNGDGRDDLVDVGVSATGIVVYVWYGRDVGWRIPPDATRRPGTIGLGVTTVGAQHAAIGDFNGDGYGDLAIGVGDADFLTGETGPSSGGVVVYLGGPNGIGRVFDRQILGASAVPLATSGEGFGT